jgi:pyruvate dehydrogenase kinase 2/3/4
MSSSSSTTTASSTNNLLFTYVPHHLHFMLAELLKNSCRAVVTNYWTQHGNCQQRNLTSLQRSAQRFMPPIRVVVAKGEEDITIKISDRGGGIPRKNCDPMWTFVHSTMKNYPDSDTTTTTNTTTTNAVYGRSFGLPLARIYARYLGGELTLQSMEGFGVDAYLYLPVLGVECEHLPKRVYNSPGNLDSQMDFTTTSASSQWMENEKSTTQPEIIVP